MTTLELIRHNARFIQSHGEDARKIIKCVSDTLETIRCIDDPLVMSHLLDAVMQMMSSCKDDIDSLYTLAETIEDKCSEEGGAEGRERIVAVVGSNEYGPITLTEVDEGGEA